MREEQNSLIENREALWVLRFESITTGSKSFQDMLDTHRPGRQYLSCSSIEFHTTANRLITSQVCSDDRLNEGLSEK